ncbi:MAG TPA: hypothetical protein VHI52_18120 [Verrucomicrobiae bacterium]|nr:hypothetical protein [Verrucomicrobiae bacterium]
MHLNRSIIGSLLASTLMLGLPGCATHSSSPANSAGQLPKPNPTDVDTISDIVRASYETISGPARNPWPWERDRTLYMPRAIFVSNTMEHGHLVRRVETPEEYRRRFLPGGYETEIGRKIERFGNVAQVRSVSVARDTPDGPITGRWVNYFQLYWDGARWWIAAMVWDQERESLPIPQSWIGKLDEDRRTY